MFFISQSLKLIYLHKETLSPQRGYPRPAAAAIIRSKRFSVFPKSDAERRRRSQGAGIRPSAPARSLHVGGRKDIRGQDGSSLTP